MTDELHAGCPSGRTTARSARARRAPPPPREQHHHHRHLRLRGPRMRTGSWSSTARTAPDHDRPQRRARSPPPAEATFDSAEALQQWMLESCATLQLVTVVTRVALGRVACARCCCSTRPTCPSTRWRTRSSATERSCHRPHPFERFEARRGSHLCSLFLAAQFPAFAWARRRSCSCDWPRARVGVGVAHPRHAPRPSCPSRRRHRRGVSLSLARAHGDQRVHQLQGGGAPVLALPRGSETALLSFFSAVKAHPPATAFLPQRFWRARASRPCARCAPRT